MLNKMLLPLQVVGAVVPLLVAVVAVVVVVLADTLLGAATEKEPFFLFMLLSRNEMLPALADAEKKDEPKNTCDSPSASPSPPSLRAPKGDGASTPSLGTVAAAAASATSQVLLARAAGERVGTVTLG